MLWFNALYRVAQLLQSERVAAAPYILYGRGYHTTGQVSPNENAN